MPAAALQPHAHPRQSQKSLLLPFPTHPSNHAECFQILFLHFIVQNAESEIAFKVPGLHPTHS